MNIKKHFRFRKMASAFTIIVLCFTSLIICVNAESTDSNNLGNEQHINFDVEIPVSNNSEVHRVITKKNDGSITESNYIYSELSSMNSSKTQSMPSYIPQVIDPYDLANSFGDASILALDEDGREKMTFFNKEKRTGQLRCGYDIDGDNDVDEWYIGTASLQSYDILISCAHVVWKSDYTAYHDGWPIEIKFYAGRTSELFYSALSSYVSVSIDMNYVNTSSALYDWSIIQIEDDLGSNYGWYGLHVCGTEFIGYDIYTFGYPVDKGGYEQWKSVGEFTSVYDNIIFHSAYTVKGNSGGPILIDDYVYAISVIYNPDDPTDSGGVRMVSWLFDLIVTACEESAERWE